MSEQLYEYVWGNNEKRKKLKGRICQVLHRGRMNSCKVRFIDNHQIEVVSRNALRKEGNYEDNTKIKSRKARRR